MSTIDTRARMIPEPRPRRSRLLARAYARRAGALVDPPSYAARLIRPFLQALAQYKGLPAFDELQATDPDERIPVGVAHDLLEIVIDRGAPRDIGLKAGRMMARGDGGALDYAISSAATLGESLEIGARYSILLNDAVEIRLAHENDRALLRFDSRVVLPRAAEDFMLAAFHTCHLTVLKDTAELEVRFSYPAPGDLGEYAETFGRAKLQFGSACPGFAFARSWLQVPLESADSKLHSVVRKHVEQMLADLPRANSLTEKVRQLIAKELPQVQPSAARIANLLRMSARTLGRRLEDEGTSFRSVLDDLRRALALRYLENDQVALAEVAFLLGFSEAAAFHRAFKRWTGKTPSEYRRTRRR